jgi:hypothetical protein
MVFAVGRGVASTDEAVSSSDIAIVRSIFEHVLHGDEVVDVDGESAASSGGSRKCDAFERKSEARLHSVST